MKSFKRGRGPSMMGGVVAVCMAVFGLIWTIMASNITKNPFGDMGGLEGVRGFGATGTTGMFNTVGSIFPIFGVVFMVIAIAIAVYNFKNATGKNRYSEFDIVDGNEEPDPLNQRFGGQAYESSEGSWQAEGPESRFCPYCGAKAQAGYEYCNQCGKKLP